MKSTTRSMFHACCDGDLEVLSRSIIRGILHGNAHAKTRSTGKPTSGIYTLLAVGGTKVTLTDREAVRYSSGGAPKHCLA